MMQLLLSRLSIYSGGGDDWQSGDGSLPINIDISGRQSVNEHQSEAPDGSDRRSARDADHLH